VSDISPFDLPPQEAIDYFRGKGLRTSFHWADMRHEEHDHAFTVAKMMDLDLLREVKQEVDKALAQGQTYRDFEAALKPLLEKRGWWGRQEMVDPATGEVVDAQLGSPRRLRTIFRVNLMTAYAAGQWEQIKLMAGAAPYLEYSAVLDLRTRPDHRSWDGKVVRIDDPWWETHFPPNGWNCRCTVIQRDDWELKRMGKTGPDKPPADPVRPWLNPRTQETEMVPQGIDPGWAYHPGRSRGRTTDEAAQEKTDQTEQEFGLAPGSIPPAVWDPPADPAAVEPAPRTAPVRDGEPTRPRRAEPDEPETETPSEENGWRFAARLLSGHAPDAALANVDAFLDWVRGELDAGRRPDDLVMEWFGRMGGAE